MRKSKSWGRLLKATLCIFMSMVMLIMSDITSLATVVLRPGEDIRPQIRPENTESVDSGDVDNAGSSSSSTGSDGWRGGLGAIGASIIWDCVSVDLTEGGATTEEEYKANLSMWVQDSLLGSRPAGVWDGAWPGQAMFQTNLGYTGHGHYVLNGSVNDRPMILELTKWVLSEDKPAGASLTSFAATKGISEIDLYIEIASTILGITPDQFKAAHMPDGHPDPKDTMIVRMVILPLEKHTDRTEWDNWGMPTWNGYNENWFRGFNSFNDFKHAMMLGDCKCTYTICMAHALFGGHSYCKGHTKAETGGFWLGAGNAYGRTSYIVTESAGTFYCRNYMSPWDNPGIIVRSGDYNFCVSAVPTGAKATFPSTVSDSFSIYLGASTDTLGKIQKIAATKPDSVFTVEVSVDKAVSDAANTSAGGLASLNVTNASPSNNSLIMTKSYTATEFLSLVSGDSSIDWNWAAALSGGVNQARHGLKFKVRVYAPSNTSNLTVGWKDATAVPASSIKGSVDDGKWDPVNSTDYASWGGSSGTHIAWDCSIGEDQNVYAEIVANAAAGTGVEDGEPILAADWNVSEGIPSTENVTVAVGGEAFTANLGGRIHAFGVPYGAVNNVGVGVDGGGAIKRTITFNVSVIDIWGDDNPRCTLSCSGHTASALYSFNVTSHGTDVTQLCPHCGQSVTAPAKFSMPEATESPSDTPTSEPTPEPIPEDNTVSHSCSISVTYDCSTGTATASGDALASYQVDSATLTNNQLYVGTATAISKGGDTVTTSAPSGALLCDGYTTSYGCVHSNEKNCATGHHRTDVHQFSVVEQADIYAYREILAAKVYALGSAKITGVNEPELFYEPDSLVGLGSTNVTLETNLWRANGKYDGKNGRVWFTQWSDPTYTSGSGWKSTVVNNTDGTSNYFLGNCTVNISVQCDSGVYELGSPGALDSVSVSPSSGRSKAHWTASSEGTTNYQSNDGDVGTTDQTLLEAIQVVNAWQSVNNNAYKVMIISDAIDVEGPRVIQNVIAECYAVDADGGVRLFDFGFTTGGEVHYRSHKSKYGSADFNAAVLNSNQIVGDYTQLGYIDDMHSFTTGYMGIMTEQPVKWIEGQGISSSFIVEDLAGGDGVRTDNGELWHVGDVRPVAGGTVWNKVISTSDTSQSGKSTCTLQPVGDSQTLRFKGYYSDFEYPCGDMKVEKILDGSSSVVDSGFSFSGLLSGGVKADGQTFNWSNPMAINDIELSWFAPNGLYINPLEVTGRYYKLLDMSNSSNCECHGVAPTLDECQTEVKSRYTGSSDAGVINDVVVHTPISTQYWQIIGNGYGDYDGDGRATDDSHEDARIGYSGKEEFDKNNYLVVGNTFHLWVTDFGDFKDSSGGTFPGQSSDFYRRRGVGSSELGADSVNGEINRNAKGYTDNMNCSRWIAGRYVSFSFPVSAYDLNGNVVAYSPGTVIDLSELRANAVSGDRQDAVTQDETYAVTSTSDGIWHYGSEKLQNFANWDSEFKYGLDYEFTVLTSSPESVYGNTRIVCTAGAINYDTNDHLPSDGTNKDRSPRVRSNSAYSMIDKNLTVDVVGRIGNLALEDVGDFRFAEVFKQAESSWLIPGVVHRVNSSAPENILTNSVDIFGNECLHTTTKQSHSSLSVTSYLIGTSYGNGKAGKWVSLPISAALNPVEEFRDQQMRMGYSAYFDIETIGNYYGVNRNEDGSFNDGLMSHEEENVKVDTREYRMDIVPHYYLYDLDDGRFYSIDLYAGTMGGYTKFYGGRDTGSATHMTESSLYIDLPTEMDRRNVTRLERTTTDSVTSTFGEVMRIPGMDAMRSAYVRSDYIGTACGITLDANDLDYIGSSYMYYQQIEGSIVKGGDARAYNQLGNENMWTGSYKNQNLLKPIDFGVQSQRWYFTLALPSSTIATYAQPESASARTQTEIVSNHEKLKEEHPNAVIIVFGDIQVTGEVWSLGYDVRSMNDGNPVIIPLFKDEDVELTDDKLEAYPEPGTTPDDNKPVEDIESEWPPLIVYDAYDTSNKDLETYGTH